MYGIIRFYRVYISLCVLFYFISDLIIFFFSDERSKRKEISKRRRTNYIFELNCAKSFSNILHWKCFFQYKIYRIYTGRCNGEVFKSCHKRSIESKQERELKLSRSMFGETYIVNVFSLWFFLSFFSSWNKVTTIKGRVQMN